MEIQEKIHKIGNNIFDYLLLIISLTAIFSAGIYYIYALNWASILVIIILTAVSFLLLRPYLFKRHSNEEKDLQHNTSYTYKNYLNYWPYFFYLITANISFYFLYISQSDKALISPWQTINSSFFIFYAISSLILVFILLKSKFSAIGKLICLSIHYFLSFSVAAIVYKIGYGFDPFIHQATMELIDKNGLVTPKPFYYLGEYGLILVLHRLSGLSIYLLNKFLVPVFGAILRDNIIPALAVG